MNWQSKWMLVGGAALALGWANRPAHATLIGTIEFDNYQTLDAPGAYVTTASSVNDQGRVVGYYELPTKGYGYSEQNGVYTTLSVPGQVQYMGGAGIGINNAGQIALSLDDGEGLVIQPDGTQTILNVPGSDATFATGINNAGQVVGYAEFLASPNPHENLFLWQNGVFTLYDPPDGGFGSALGINNAGQVVGTYYDHSDILHGFIWQNGVYSDLEVPGALHTYPVGINDLGQVVGHYLDGTDSYLFEEENGQFDKLVLKGGVGVGADGINNLGQITGYYVGASQTHGFLTPEPSSLALMGLASLIGLRRHRRG